MSFVTTYSNPTSVLPSGVSRGISGSSFISSMAGAAATRYGPTLMKAAVNRIDNIVADAANKISQTKTANPTNATKDNNNGSNDNGGSSKPPGGRRKSKSNQNQGRAGIHKSGGVPLFNFNSGIPSGTIENDLQETTDDYSPLYIISGQFFPNPAENPDSKFTQHLGLKIYYDYLQLIESQVNAYLSREFTEDAFKHYIMTISESLQLYYMIDSILAYTSHSPNVNLGMVKLRMSITPEIYNYHIQLKEILETTTIPPNLLGFIRYMYQNFSFSDIKGSSIVRLSYFNSLCTAEKNGMINIELDVYKNLIEDIIHSSKITSAIKKVRPNWITQMPPSSYDALFSPPFCTFWHNCNIAFEDFNEEKTVKYSINVQTPIDKLGYGIFGDHLDGLIYASASIYLSEKVMELGFWKPFDDFETENSTNSSLLYFSKDGLIRPVLEPSYRFSSMVRYAPNVLIGQRGEFEWSVTSCNFLGTRLPQYHSIENVTQAISKGVIYLLQP